MKEFQFTPKADFFSPEFRSQYTAGLTYTVKEGNEELRTAAEKWIAEGKVEVFTGAKKAVNSATIKGKGEVK